MKMSAAVNKERGAAAAAPLEAGRHPRGPGLSTKLRARPASEPCTQEESPVLGWSLLHTDLRWLFLLKTAHCSHYTEQERLPGAPARRDTQTRQRSWKGKCLWASEKAAATNRGVSQLEPPPAPAIPVPSRLLDPGEPGEGPEVPRRTGDGEFPMGMLLGRGVGARGTPPAPQATRTRLSRSLDLPEAGARVGSKPRLSPSRDRGPGSRPAPSRRWWRRPRVLRPL
ncbi:uncharacterized protein LOC128568971 isoform X2 [Nycticebus coucang]|nr:uncharacterized protein LOC128568971 isoform X2 [Nycticebus coucang]